jgi:hypothetical protein
MGTISHEIARVEIVFSSKRRYYDSEREKGRENKRDDHIYRLLFITERIGDIVLLFSLSTSLGNCISAAAELRFSIFFFAPIRQILRLVGEREIPTEEELVQEPQRGEIVTIARGCDNDINGRNREMHRKTFLRWRKELRFARLLA